MIPLIAAITANHETAVIRVPTHWTKILLAVTLKREKRIVYFLSIRNITYKATKCLLYKTGQKKNTHTRRWMFQFPLAQGNKVEMTKVNH